MAPLRYERLSPNQRRALQLRVVKMYKAGESIRAAARAVDVSYGTARRLLLSPGGVPLRTRGGDLRSAERKAKAMRATRAALAEQRKKAAPPNSTRESTGRKVEKES